MPNCVISVSYRHLAEGGFSPAPRENIRNVWAICRLECTHVNLKIFVLALANLKNTLRYVDGIVHLQVLIMCRL